MALECPWEGHSTCLAPSTLLLWKSKRMRTVDHFLHHPVNWDCFVAFGSISESWWSGPASSHPVLVFRWFSLIFFSLMSAVFVPHYAVHPCCIHSYYRIDFHWMDILQCMCSFFCRCTSGLFQFWTTKNSAAMNNAINGEHRHAMLLGINLGVGLLVHEVCIYYAFMKLLAVLQSGLINLW